MGSIKLPLTYIHCEGAGGHVHCLENTTNLCVYNQDSRYRPGNLVRAHACARNTLHRLRSNVWLSCIHMHSVQLKNIQVQGCIAYQYHTSTHNNSAAIRPRFCVPCSSSTSLHQVTRPKHSAEMMWKICKQYLQVRAHLVGVYV